MLKVGDKVVYPMHGAGIIKKIETKEMGDETAEYVVIECTGGLKLMVPEKNATAVGLRGLSSEEDLKRVYEILSESISSMPPNWNKRYRENMERIKSGDICKVAEVVKNLMILDAKKPLSTGERKLLNSARNTLISEMAMISDREYSEVLKEVEGIVSGSK